MTSDDEDEVSNTELLQTLASEWPDGDFPGEELGGIQCPITGDWLAVD